MNYVPEWKRLGITPKVQNPLPDQNIGHNPYSNLEQDLVMGKKRTLEEALTEEVIPVQEPEEEIDVVEERSGIHISVGQFAVVFRGDLVFTGDFDEVETFVTSLVMGETELTPIIDPDEVMVLKRVQIKSGIFLAE